MKIAIYCDANLTNLNWIETEVLEYIYFLEESFICVLDNLKEIAIICPNDNTTKSIAQLIVENRPAAQLSYKYEGVEQGLLVLLTKNGGQIPTGFIHDRLNMNVRYYDEAAEAYLEFKNDDSDA